jgi:hypothetical protein
MDQGFTYWVRDLCLNMFSNECKINAGNVEGNCKVQLKIQNILKEIICLFRYSSIYLFVGRDSSAAGLDGPGTESHWGQPYSHHSRAAPGPTQSPLQWVPGSFPGGKMAI